MLEHRAFATLTSPVETRERDARENVKARRYAYSRAGSSEITNLLLFSPAPTGVCNQLAVRTYVRT